MTKITYKFILFLCLTLATTSLFAASEAEYGKVSKNWTLHNDGSQEFRHRFELTLFTHTAMNNTYGESFIVYNPNFQTLKINGSYTKQKDGTIVKTPSNAFVEVLPAFAANAPAYNQLKEMVVVHTGLELGATIYLDYSIITKPGYFPALDIDEILQESSPIKMCDVTISVPENHPLNWQLLGDKTKASQVSRNGIKTISYQLKNLPATSREAFLPQNKDENIRLIASSYTSNKEALSIINKRFNESLNYESNTFATYITETAKNATEKLQRLLNHVVNNLDYSPIPFEYTGFMIRDVDEALRSAYGTLAEKSQLLSAMLNAIDIPAQVIAIYPGSIDINACGLKAIKDFAVKVTVDGKTHYLSANSLTPSSIIRRGRLDQAFTLDGTALSITAEPLIINENRSIDLSKEPAQDTFMIYTLPTLSNGVDSWDMSALNSKRSSLFEIPSLIEETIRYVITPPANMKLQNTSEKQNLSNTCGKATQTIEKTDHQIVVTRYISINKQQFTPAEYKELRELIQMWSDPNKRILIWKE